MALRTTTGASEVMWSLKGRFGELPPFRGTVHSAVGTEDPPAASHGARENSRGD